MSPCPPAFSVENVHAGVSSGASAGEMSFSRSWKRLFERSRP
jgi:hypothetical protein